MRFLEAANALREKARQHGKYKEVGEKTGVNYHWLQQFACGAIKNPTINNLDKIESFYEDSDSQTEAA